MSAWRPEDWETVKEGMRLYKGKPLRSTKETFEAGADAMLEAVCVEVEKAENPYPRWHEAIKTENLHWGIWETARQEILARFRSK